MSFILDMFTGKSAGRAATQAAAIQADSGREAIASQERALGTVRRDLSPFAALGRHSAEELRGPNDELLAADLSGLVRNPVNQRDFIEQNPFFESLAKDAETRIFNNQAARGKIGSGETAKALQNSLLLLGPQLVNQSIQQRTNLATLGANAAAGQATATQNSAANIGNTLTGIGNAQASGIVGAANARSQGQENLLGLGKTALTAFMLSDIRTKTDITPLGTTHGGLGIYRYRYKGDDEPRVGVMAQEVEQVDPSAVKTIAGLKVVDYERVR